jgi:hypothetical protein
MKKFFAGILLFALPVAASAAGFAKQSIFLSTNAPVAGEAVLIHASVSNDATTTFTGTLKVHDDEGTIGSVPVTLAAGGASDVSVTWEPTAGAHTVVADLTDSSGTVVEENSQAFTIAAPPTPVTDTAANEDTSGVQPSTQIQQSIASVSPVAAQVSTPVLQALDSGRVAAANQLNKAVAWSKAQVGAPVTSPTSAFIKTPDAATQNKTASSVWTIFATAVLYILTIVLYIVSNAAIFYILFVCIFFYILWKCWRRYRRKY